MVKLKVAINPELSKFIKESFPVVRKRSALWFFSEGLKNNLTPTVSNINDCNKPTDHVPTNAEPGNSNNKITSLEIGDKSRLAARHAASQKISRNKILQLWRNMDPESKRWYFKMSELDEVRYKEQKSIWVTEVVSLFNEHGCIERVEELAPTKESLQNRFEGSVDVLQRSYEQMIETESTKMIYKNAIKRAHEPSLETGELISAVPRQQRAILTKPRRPPAAFVLYMGENMDRYTEMRQSLRLKISCMKIAAGEWAKLDRETRKVYDDKYYNLKIEYDRAMESYKAEFMDSDESYLQSALREKRAFRRSLRKRLRDSSILPGGIRNPFNFFVMDNKDVKLSDLLMIWRDLSPEAKEKYLKLNEDDRVRYQKEIEAYNQMRKTISEIGYKRRSKSESDIK